MQVEILGFDERNSAYSSCLNFSLMYADLCSENRNHHVDFVVHDGFLFSGSKLCIPKALVQDLLIWEMHARGLDGHLGKDRTIPLVKDHFY